jgi:hypothetical protein
MAGTVRAYELAIDRDLDRIADEPNAGFSTQELVAHAVARAGE